MAKQFSVDLKLNKEFQAQLALSGKEGQNILIMALNMVGQTAFAASQNMVPDSGDGILRNSGVLNPAVPVGETGAEVTMGYGGAAAKYALRQHEDEALHHPDPTNPRSSRKGQAHYLSLPVQNRKSELSKRVVEGLALYFERMK